MGQTLSESPEVILLDGGGDGYAGIDAWTDVSRERRHATGRAFTNSSTPVTKSDGIEMRKGPSKRGFIRRKPTGRKAAARPSVPA